MTRKKGRPANCPYVGKGGLKLQFALEEMDIDVVGKTTGDLGCNIGGFTDCMLQGGAEKIYAVDSGYGFLDYKLRKDPRVIVCERTNALHWEPPELLDIVTIDLAWTPQNKSLPAAAKIIRPDGIILSLVKPQYEADKSLLNKGVLPEACVDEVMAGLRDFINKQFIIIDERTSPLKGHTGNIELWLHLRNK